MHAFVLKRYGGPEGTELREMPKPEPGAHELLVRVHAAGLNPIDYKTRRGALLPIYRYPLPVVMGKDLAGTILAPWPPTSGQHPRHGAGPRELASSAKIARTRASLYLGP